MRRSGSYLQFEQLVKNCKEEGWRVELVLIFIISQFDPFHTFVSHVPLGLSRRVESLFRGLEKPALRFGRLPPPGQSR